MIKYFIPDRCFLTFDMLTPAFLEKEGIRGLILDIDNTVAPYEEAEPGPVAIEWFKHLEEAGIRIAFVSNNCSARVNEFNRTLGYPHYPNSKKPFGKYIRQAMAAMGTDRSNTALMGDQIFTDVLAARMAGLKRTFLVPPIKDKTDWFTRFKRRMERPILEAYRERRREKKRLRRERRAERRLSQNKKRFRVTAIIRSRLPKKKKGDIQ